jgi:hypothetical protein
MQTTFPAKGLGENLPFLFACHRKWVSEGKGIVRAGFRDEVLYRDVELENKLRRLDEWIQHFKDTS